MPTGSIQALGGSLWTDPRNMWQGPAFMPALGGAWVNDPTKNPEYLRSVQGGGQAFPGRNLSSSTAGRPTSEGGPPAPAAPAPSLYQSPSLQPPQIDMAMLSQLFGGGARQPDPSYSSAIGAGPVWGAATTDNAVQSLRNSGSQGLSFGQVPGVNMSGSQMAALNSQASRSGQAASNRAANQFSRDAAQGNHQQLMASQQARASEGVQLANMVAQLQGQRLEQDRIRQRSLLGALTGMMG